MSGPLDGVRVVEICSAISGPFATKLLGDLGAEVVKIESTDGVADRTRDLPYDRHDRSEYTWRFLNYNTSKDSVALDLKAERGKEILTALLEETDAVVENMRPGSMERLGFGWDRLRTLNPALVYCSIKGYGTEGPYRDRPALDTLVQGVSGFATQVGRGTDPEPMRILVVDMTTGLYAAWATTAALFERAESGRGQRVDVSMLDATVSMLGHQLAEYTAGQHHDSYEAAYDTAFVPNGYYATGDGHVSLFITAEHWASFCEAIDRPAWADPGHRYGTNEKRLDRLSEFREDLESVLSTRTSEGWLEHFQSRESPILAAPVNDIGGMIADPQVRAQGAVRRETHREMGEYYVPGVAPKFSRTPGSLSDAPGLGDATDRVLADLGYTEEELASLREEGVVR